ncbi:hypothetical protein [Flavobacterium hydatis]|uniref:Uncharacterized protein n=1 Tax=Flavobacterium hydatis TaxID=991 RepID=A0A085ZWT1_FLAHY|nr:hypothetical protein [Flavobacterium hydatis]KFF08895.1 hypothetical protein IW20_23450 [Flavobacterium hydatis]OXA95820.1 hypothetical protein B0A62_07500 [Flavobacterium hydatis]
MSYLNVPRLTFSGQFQADPSTVNNDPSHFNNETFEPDFQDYSTADTPNGWWNPDGTGNWRFLGCKITSVTYQDGTSTDDSLLDPVIGMTIIDTNARTAGKIVDLDSQQQMVSQLWGFIVRIVNNEGDTLVKGDYDVAAFSNIWFNRSVDQSADSAAGATYQSILKNIEWNFEISNSRYLNELKSASADQLSIQFNVDRYNGDYTSPQFTLGRITGSIGPSSNSEPKHFVLGRQLFPAVPGYNYATALVDEKLNQVVLDFGNALQFSTGGVVNSFVDLHLVIDTSTAETVSYVDIGKIDYSNPDWYMGTSGILTFPLSDEQLNLINQYPLAITQILISPDNVFTVTKNQTSSVIYTESVDYVCADKFVFRLDPDQEIDDPFVVNFYATSFGKPLANTVISIFQSGVNDNGYKSHFKNPPSANNAPLLPPYSFQNLAPSPINGTPITALGISADQKNPSATLATDNNGFVSITIPYSDPGLVREFKYYQLNSDKTEYNLIGYDPPQFMDGQYYSINYCLQSQLATFPNNINPSNTLSVLIFNGPKTLSGIQPDWESFIQPIMQQYANLYPLMSKGIFNLADKAVFENNAQILHLVFSKDPEDPNYMPATRDLSKYKKTVILNYLQGIIDNGTGTKA